MSVVERSGTVINNGEFVFGRIEAKERAGNGENIDLDASQGENTDEHEVSGDSNEVSSDGNTKWVLIFVQLNAPLTLGSPG